jgi:hypothetical protein
MEELNMSRNEELERIAKVRHFMEISACNLHSKAAELRDIAEMHGLPMRGKLNLLSAKRQLRYALEIMEQIDASLPGEKGAA